MRLLLVEDDPMIAESVLDALTGLRHAVDWAQDGRAAELALANGVYDLVLLDLGLPKLDGLSVLQQYRASGGSAAVIVVTARNAVTDRISGLDAGADDYLTNLCLPNERRHLEFARDTVGLDRHRHQRNHLAPQPERRVLDAVHGLQARTGRGPDRAGGARVLDRVKQPRDRPALPPPRPPTRQRRPLDSAHPAL